MKKFTYLLSTLALVLVLSGNAFGQVNVEASANIIQQIEWDDNESEIEFGELPADFSSATISPSSTGGDEGLYVGFEAARVSITGASDQTVVFDVDESTTLDQGEDSDELILNITYTGEAGDNTADRGGASLTDDELTLSEDGEATLWFGGTLEAADIVNVGKYTGKFTVSFDYTF